MRGKGEWQAERGSEFGGKGRGAEEVEWHLEAGAGHSADRLVGLRLAEEELQLLNVAGKPLGLAATVAQRLQYVAVAAGRPAEAEIDAAGIERGQRAELLGDDERRVVRQHDPA